MFKENMVKKILIIMMIVIFSVMVSSGSVLIESTKVEAAKKDKKKPTVKIKGNKNISADVGKKVIIPKIIYSDNKTKKSKLKVGVTVKKGNKNYKTIANKIKKATVKNKSTSVIFEEEGTYKITYTITDLAKNKSIAVRYVMVSKDDGIQKEEYLIGNNILIVRFTNETENDIGLTVHISYKDEQYEGDSGFSQQYLPVGKSFVVVEKRETKLEKYNISYEISAASPSVKAYYEKTPFTITENEFGGLDYTLTDNTESGYSDMVTIFYENSEGKILGYDELQYGGGGDFKSTFEKPAYEYDKYEIIRTKM